MAAGRKDISACALAVVWAALRAAPAGGCDVPVFRWALENWEPDRFEIVIFHRGPLGQGDRGVVSFLEAASADRPGGANLIVRLADLSGKLEAPIEKIWRAQGGPDPPWMVLLAPAGFEPDADRRVWAGPLTAPAAEAIVDSPVRREIVRRILGGDSAVWVLLDGGDRAADEAAARLLRAELKKAEASVQLPEPYPDDFAEVAPDEGEPAEAAPDDGQPAELPEAKAAFSLVRLRRADPAEAAFAAMLLACEPGLKAGTPAGPMAFPVYGRGRVVCALLGKGINAENVLEVCEFVVGPCSCIVKADNPGADVLFRADWEAAVGVDAPGGTQQPVLMGLPAGPGQDDPPRAAPLVAAAPPGPEGPGNLVRNVLIAMGFVVAAAWVAALVVSRRASRS